MKILINLTLPNSWCLKITEKVSFNIASEASYVYILSEQNLIKSAKNGQFGEFLKNWCLWSNGVTRQVTFKRTKIDGKCQNSKIQMRHFKWFLNNVRKDDAKVDFSFSK